MSREDGVGAGGNGADGADGADRADGAGDRKVDGSEAHDRAADEDRRVRRTLRVGRSRPDLDRDVRDEVEFYLDMRTDELVAAGHDPAEARRIAESSFGDRAGLEERIKRVSAPVWRRRRVARALDELGRDVRHALRTLRRAPGFTAAAVLILALGIGAVTAVFSAVSGVLLEPLDYPEPHRLVQIWETDRRDGSLEDPVSPVDLADWQALSTTLEAIAGYSYEAMALTREGSPERAVGIAVSSSFFRVMGVEPALGRRFQPGEEGPGNRVVVLGDAIWKDRFGGDPEVVGRTLGIDGVPHVIVGVMPPGFTFPSSGQLWVPFSFDVGELDRGQHFLFAVGRLAQGVVLEEAQEEMTALAARLEEEYPGSNADQGIHLVPLHEQMVGDVEFQLWVVLGAVSLVLLIACGNVGNLLLVRAASRRSEMNIRAALGAGRWRLVRQLLTESVVLSLLAGALGALAAFWGTDALLAASPVSLPRAAGIGVDGTMLLFALGLSSITGALFGVIPSLPLFGSSRPNRRSGGVRGLGTALTRGLGGPGGRATSGTGTRALRDVLVVGEVALTLVLLVGAGLLIGNVARLQRVDPGFDPDGVLTARIALPRDRYDTPQEKAAFLDAVLERLDSLPRVAASGAVDSLPFSGSRSASSFEAEGELADPDAQRAADLRIVSPGYLGTIGVPLIRGRGISRDDDAGALPVILVNRAFARRFFGLEGVVGRRLRIGSPEEVALWGEPVWREIVGVVGDLIHDDLTTRPVPELYVPYRQLPTHRISLAVRSEGDALEAAGLTDALRRVVLEVDPDQPLYDVATMTERLDRFLAAPRASAGVVTAFAAAALLLAVLGIYSVVSYTVTLRRRELGVRVALGAEPGAVMRLVLGDGMARVGTGLAVGLGVSFVAAETIRSLLFGIDPADPLILVIAASILGATGLAACWVPARRALRVDPVEVLRGD